MWFCWHLEFWSKSWWSGEWGRAWCVGGLPGDQLHLNLPESQTRSQSAGIKLECKKHYPHCQHHHHNSISTHHHHHSWSSSTSSSAIWLFNHQGRLNTHIRDPNAADLVTFLASSVSFYHEHKYVFGFHLDFQVHHLFPPLAFLMDACLDLFDEDVQREVASPFMTQVS